MKNYKTPRDYIKNLWSKNKLNNKFTINHILSCAESEGHAFERSSIRKSLLKSSFIAKPKKIKGINTYSQKYPPDSNSIPECDKLYILVFKNLDLHKDIRKASSKLFLDSYYDQAVFAAFKKLNNLVKKKSKQPSKDGKDLMMSTFTPKCPILKLNNLVTDSEINEQEGFMHIFAGSIQGIRNPQGHDDEIGENPWNTIELLCLASLLTKKLEKSILNKNNKKLKRTKN